MCNGAHWAWAETVEQRTTENSIRCRIIIIFLSLSSSLASYNRRRAQVENSEKEERSRICSDHC